MERKNAKSARSRSNPLPLIEIKGQGPMYVRQGLKRAGLTSFVALPQAIAHCEP